MPRHESPKVTRAANAILAAGGLLCLLALVYLARRQGLTGKGPSLGEFRPLIPYLIPAVSSVLLFGSLWLRPSIKSALALVLSSTAVSILAVELILEAVSRADDRATIWTPATRQGLEELVRIARKAGVTYDARSKLEVLMDLRSADPGVTPAIVPKGLLAAEADGTLRSRITIDGREILALGGISGRTTLFCNESGEWVTYLSDEHGFNNPPGIWSSSKLDVAVLGDSYAQGACVGPDANSAVVIRNRYPGTLNLGMLGNGPLMELAQLKEYVAAFEPKIVLWLFYEENDFADLQTESRSPVLMRYLKGPFRQDLLALQPELDEALEAYVAEDIDRERDEPALDERSDRSAVRAALRRIIVLRNLRQRLGLVHASGGAREDHRVVSDETMGLLSDVMAAAKSTVGSWGGNLYLVYLPERQRYADAHTEGLDETNRKRMLGLARELDIRVIDIHSVIRAHDDPLSLYPFRRRGHFNEDGYRLVGESVLESLAEHGRH